MPASAAGRALGWYYEISGPYREGIEQLEPLALTLQATESDVISHRLLGLVLIHLALLYFRIGEFDRAQNLYEDGIAALRLVGDQKLLADGLIYLGIILHLKGDYSRAQVILEEGRISAGASNDCWLEAYAILNLGSGLLLPSPGKISPPAPAGRCAPAAAVGKPSPVEKGGRKWYEPMIRDRETEF